MKLFSDSSSNICVGSTVVNKTSGLIEISATNANLSKYLKDAYGINHAKRDK